MEVPETADDNCAWQCLEWSCYTNATSCNIPSIKKRYLSTRPPALIKTAKECICYDFSLYVLCLGFVLSEVHLQHWQWFRRGMSDHYTFTARKRCIPVKNTSTRN